MIGLNQYAINNNYIKNHYRAKEKGCLFHPHCHQIKKKTLHAGKYYSGG